MDGKSQVVDFSDFIRTHLERLQDSRRGVKLFSFLRSHFKPDKTRLHGELHVFVLKLQSFNGRPGAQALQNSIIDLTTHSIELFFKNKLDESWKCLLEAERLLIFLYDKDDLANISICIQARGMKILTGWRREAFKAIFDAKGERADMNSKLFAASGLIIDSQNSRFFTLDLVRMHTAIIFLILLLACIFFIIFFSLTDFQSIDNHLGGPVNIFRNKSTERLLFCIEMTIVGSIGSCVSALISFSQIPQNSRIPDRIFNFYSTFGRTVVGAASGLMSAFILSSGLFHFIHQNIALYFVIAFVFGFSERLILHTVTTVTQENSKDSKSNN